MTIDETLYDVAVVGYGPTGGVLANLLGLQGLKVAVIERTRSIYPKPRGIACYPEGWRIMQVAGVGKDYIPKSTTLGGGVYTGADGEPILKFDIPPPPYDQAWHPARSIIQTELEEDIRKGIPRFKDVKELLGYSVVGLDEKDDAVTLKLRVFNEEKNANETDGEISVRTKFVVGCDGGTSAVRKLIGVKMNSLGFDEWWAAIDAYVLRDDATNHLDPDMGYLYCNPKRPGLTFPCPRNIRRWEIKLLPGENPADFSDEENGPQRCLKLVEEFGTDLDSIKLWRAAVYQLHCLVADSFASKSMRVFIAGDAAHQMPPFMGQGLVSGVRDASFLAWRLAYYLKNQQSIPPNKSNVLASYEVELKPFMTHIVGVTKFLGNIIGELDLEKAQKRDFGMREAMKSEKPSSWEDRLPNLEGGLIALGSPGAGKNFVQPWVFTADGKREMMDDTLPHPARQSFLLVGSSVDAVTEWLNEDNSAFFEQIGAQKLVCLPKDAKDGFAGSVGGVPVVREEHEFLSNFLKEKGYASVAVVRPERSYCYGTAASADQLNDLVAGLKKMLV
ncbi:FAD/NAD(P)-binding domain-containing protein [Gonapodya prolifera JEL478]|uniref:FAD/NAD(P)-binding domain-containing protein n=1 Tax=Gonapodya prolifera (strain JEL478) TaxID=1344416 RepID=A0A138ZYD6_GONPJ|nr:FAD/NAD(P)-binding domain-containing protein [Gonapodya prolifera JEL478]|eukprot:KXS09518.1 FAD/NAD(P)-binding domain-containing protein [Gonapodya prolifera JEL478]